MTDSGRSGELTRLRERVEFLERELLGARSAALLDSLLDSPIPVWTTRDDRILAANRAAARLVGVASENDLAGRCVLDFLPIECHEEMRASFRREEEFGEDCPIIREEQIITERGERIDVQITVCAIMLENRRARHVSFLDITERKAAEKKLLDVHERFHDLAGSVREVFSIIEPESRRLLYVSPGYESIWERSCQSLYENPLSWLEAVHPEDLPRVEKAAESLETFKEEYRILNRHGDVRWIRGRTFPVRSETGELLRIVGCSEEISEWKKLEQQLTQSQKMDAVGRLAGGIAHDFNNLLTVINGYASLLAERGDVPPDMMSGLRSIRHAGDRAASLTAQLLAFSRMGTLQPRGMDLNTAVAEVELILRRLIREDVDLKTVLQAEPVPVMADPTQMEQVLLNLVINARDAIDGTGTILIETGCAEFDADTSRMHGGCGVGRFAMLAVTDSGRGMSPATQERIFEPFFTTKPHGQGTGLGLANVYGIVKQSGGTIWVYSEEGVGTTFKVYMPMAEKAEVTGSGNDQKVIAAHSATILLVEDDDQVRNIAAAVLKSRGHFVLASSNGEDALNAASLLPGGIDLLVTDVIMPKMSGPDLAEQLTDLYPAMRVLFISGYTQSAVIHKGMIRSGVNHLDKPFTPDMLARKVAEVLSAPAAKEGALTAAS